MQMNLTNRYEQYPLKNYLHIVKTTLYMYMPNFVSYLTKFVRVCVFCNFTGNVCFNMVTLFSVSVQASLYEMQVCSFGKFVIMQLLIIIYIRRTFRNLFASLVIVTSLMFVNIDIIRRSHL